MEHYSHLLKEESRWLKGSVKCKQSEICLHFILLYRLPQLCVSLCYALRSRQRPVIFFFKFPNQASLLIAIHTTALKSCHMAEFLKNFFSLPQTLVFRFIKSFLYPFFFISFHAIFANFLLTKEKNFTLLCLATHLNRSIQWWLIGITTLCLCSSSIKKKNRFKQKPEWKSIPQGIQQQCLHCFQRPLFRLRKKFAETSQQTKLCILAAVTCQNPNEEIEQVFIEIKNLIENIRNECTQLEGWAVISFQLNQMPGISFLTLCLRK